MAGLKRARGGTAADCSMGTCARPTLRTPAVLHAGARRGGHAGIGAERSCGHRREGEPKCSVQGAPPRWCLRV